MPKTTKELIEELEYSHDNYVYLEPEIQQEIIQRLRQLEELKEIIACGVPQLEEFIRDLEIHKK